ncbi:MAG: DNA-binding protein [Dokdonella sp.]
MARGGVYKTEIEKARNALLAEGKHPSVDAVRVALGNTGSKTTIHRYLKELEAEDNQGVGGKFPLSDALTDLVSRLAGRLNEEADARITDVQAQSDTRAREHVEAMERQRQEGAALSAQLQRSDVALQAERDEHTATRHAFQDATVAMRELEERVAGLTSRLADHEAHAQSLEEKHRHAREALEHFRTSTKEQRDQEQRRHEHQVQELQVELRKTNETVTAKNLEVLRLNRDNARMIEQIGQVEKDLQASRSESRQAQQELAQLRPIKDEAKALETRWSQAVQTIEQQKMELADAQAAAGRARDAQREAEALAMRTQGRLDATEELLGKLTAVRPERNEGSAA